MAQITGPTDVYRILVEESEDRWEFGLLAFAIIEEQRFEWARHFETQNGRAPTEAEVTHWYRQQPESVLRRARAEAERTLQIYVEDAVSEILDEERRNVREGTIVQEIRLARRFWPQFGISVSGGVVGSIVFAALLGLLAFLIFTDPSPVQLGRQLTHGAPHGDANQPSSDQ